MTPLARILLIVSGGIAAYKSLELIRRGRDRGMAFRVILTRGGAEFVTPLCRIFAERHAVLEADFVGTHIGTFAGIPATRRKVRVPLCVVYDLEEGKIKRGRVYMEVPVLLKQLGAGAAETEVAKR